MSRRVPIAPAARRSFLRRAGCTLVGITAIQPFQALCARAEGRFSGSPRDPFDAYGPLDPVVDQTTGLPLLKLPRGFRYHSFGWTGDPLSDGRQTPPFHDGMAVLAQSPGKVVLCRNHEVPGSGPSLDNDLRSFDPQAPAGCTHLVFDIDAGKLDESWISLAGTSRNCAGGPTPWGTWLSCEETVKGPGDTEDGRSLGFRSPHGWIFEVDSTNSDSAKDQRPEPLVDMGRFVHEAVAIDPRSGFVYETEDRDRAGLYRFRPNVPGRLAAGGVLEMLKVESRPELRTGVPRERELAVTWVPIDDPTRAHSPGTIDEQGVFLQGKAKGASTFARLEGCWFGNDRLVFTSTSGGDAGMGQVWELDPSRDVLRLVFESPGPAVLNFPDNVTVSPRGGILLGEDGSSPAERLFGLGPSGWLFPFAENNIVLRGERNGLRGDFRDQEWTGPSFSPDGQWLFVNIQVPGVSFAITGPWQTGPL